MNLTNAKFCAKDETKAGGQSSKSSKGTSDNRLPATGKAEWIACMRDSLARIFPLLAREQAFSGETAAVSGSGPLGSFACYDPDTLSWKTHQLSFLEDSTSYSEIWPKSGMMRDGLCYQLPQSVPPTLGRGGGASVPTPTEMDASEMAQYSRGDKTKPVLTLVGHARLWPTVCKRDYKGAGRSRMERTGQKCGENLSQTLGGQLNPTWVEWLMGWPIGATELRP